MMPNTISTVSYTHLDVYKRQDDGGSAGHRHDEVGEEGAEGEVLDAVARGDDRGIRSADDEAVHYTHLEVYKRQVLVSRRYHLARAQALARGLGLQPVLCAAEERLGRDPWTCWRLVLEAYYLHWYAVGKTWSRWTGNRHSLARIT